MKKVLTCRSRKPIKPRVGMDLVIHERIKELAQDANIALTVVAVAPGIDGQPVPGRHSVGDAQVDMLLETY